jgi:hypothetical protein
MRNLVQSLAVLRNVEAFQLMLAGYPQRHEGLGADVGKAGDGQDARPFLTAQPITPGPSSRQLAQAARSRSVTILSINPHSCACSAVMK